MNMNHETNGAGFALGIVIGAVAGAGLALLFAPKPGAQLRGEIGESMTTLRDAAARRLHDVSERAGAGLSDLHAAANKAALVAGATARDIIDSATDRRPDGRAHV